MNRWIALGVVVLFSSTGPAADWPQFLGPTRDAHSPEKGLLKTLPKDGPTVLWKMEVGEGYSAPVVAGDRLILFHRVGAKEAVECLEASTGKKTWYFSYPTDYQDQLGKGDGPRSTPLIDGKQVFTLSADGRLHCLELETGKKVWMRSLNEDYAAPPSFFGVTTSPLIEGNLVVVNVGGKGSGIVALDRQTGKEIWKATDDEASNSSPVAATIDGRRMLVFFTRTGLKVLEPATGKLLHELRWRARINASVNAAAPIVVGDEIHISASYNVGGIVLRISKDGLEKRWSNDTSLSSHFSTSVYHDGFLYGFNGRQEQGADFRCVDWKTGKVRWTKGDFGCGAAIFADGRLYVFTESGDLVIVEATPESYQEKSRASVLTGPFRSHPALADGRLFARDNEKLVCWKLKE